MMENLNELTDDHRGGSFIYVPYSNTIYCVAGLMSVVTECMKLRKSCEITTDLQWKFCNKLSCPRGYYSSFVQNDSVIYLILGFDLWDNEYLSTVDRFDVKSNDGWKVIKLESEKIPKLSFTACIACSDDEVYIMGGKDENHVENTFLFIYDTKKDTFEDSNMRLPLNPRDEDSKNLFYQENCFLGLVAENDNYSKAYSLALFDSRNYLHLINVKNFDYSYISHDIPQGYQVEDIIVSSSNLDSEVEMSFQSEKSEKNSNTKSR